MSNADHNNQQIHYLETGFATACGKSRHFVLEIAPVACRISEVTCPICLSSEIYQEHRAIRDREIAAMDARH